MKNKRIGIIVNNILHLKNSTEAYLVLKIDSDLNIVDTNNQIILSLKAYLNSQIKTNLIFNIDSNKTLKSFLSFVKNYRLFNYIVISSNLQVLKALKSNISLVPCGLIVNSNKKADYNDILEKINSINSKLIFLGDEIEEDIIRFLQKRLLTCITINNTNLILNIGNQIIVGHRGIPDLAPENTLQGSILASKYVDIIETDIHLCKDNKIVIMHDNKIDRTTNGSGLIEKYTLEQLKKFNIVYHNKITKYKIPTLEEYFYSFKKSEIILFIEIKSENYSIINILKKLIYAYKMENKVVLISFNIDMLKACHKLMPFISLGILTKQKPNLKIIKDMKLLNATYHPNYKVITPELVDNMHDCLFTIWPWNYDNLKIFNIHKKYDLNGMTVNNAKMIKDYND